jgi:DNA polymerase/3'-5' exonuclease PolX
VIRTHRKFRNGAGSEEASAAPPRHASSSNELAADILESLAERLSQGRGSAKRIAAYRKAADAIRRSSYTLDELWNRGDGHALTAIPGVTPAVAQVLTELITSKRIPIGSD